MPVGGESGLGFLSCRSKSTGKKDMPAPEDEKQVYGYFPSCYAAIKTVGKL